MRVSDTYVYLQSGGKHQISTTRYLIHDAIVLRSLLTWRCLLWLFRWRAPSYMPLYSRKVTRPLQTLNIWVPRLRLEAHLNEWEGNIGEVSDRFNSTRLSSTNLSKEYVVHRKWFTFFHPNRRWYLRHLNYQAQVLFVPKASEHSLIRAKKCDRSLPRALSSTTHVVLR